MIGEVGAGQVTGSGDLSEDIIAGMVAHMLVKVLVKWKLANWSRDRVNGECECRTEWQALFFFTASKHLRMPIYACLV